MLDHAYMLTTTVKIKYCLPNHYNAHHMQFTKRKPEPELISYYCPVKFHLLKNLGGA